MATKRGKIWYTKRAYPGVGKMEKSLHTRSKSRAEHLEGILERLPSQGHTDLLRAFECGQVSVHRIAEHWDSGRIHDLAQDLRTESMTLGGAVDAALAWKEPDVAESTHERYTTGLEHFTAHVGADVDVAEALHVDKLQSFKAARLKAVSKNTVNNDLCAVSVLASYAVMKGLIAERPMIKRYAYTTRIKYLEKAEIAAYMAAIRRPFRCQQLLLLSTGMRLGESEALRVCDVRDGHSEMRLSILDSKTETGVRSVFVPPWVAEALHSHMEGEGLSGKDQLFKMKRRTVQAEHDRACDLVGIYEYTIHDHRHTAAVALARAGIPLQILQRQLGHKHIDMTMKYATFHPDYADVAPHFERMGRMLGLYSTSVSDDVEESLGDSLGDTPPLEGHLTGVGKGR